MPGMLFVGVFLPAAFVCFLIVWSLIGAYFKVKPFWLYLLGGVPAFVVLLFALAFIHGFVNSMPGRVFRESFGFETPPDVRVVNSSWGGYFDSDSRFLRFYADQSTIDRIVSLGLTRQRDWNWNYPSDMPTWWRPCPDRNSLVYTYDDDQYKRRRGHSYEHEILIYDASSKEAYFSYTGID